MAVRSVMMKPVSGACNLRCRYCFYADEIENRQVSIYGAMTEKTLEAIVKKTLEQADGPCSFGFQGGEPTLAGLDFFQRLMELENVHNRRNLPISHMLQTNGLLLDEKWAVFLREHGFLVGLSLDGPRELHDANRLDAEGNGTFDRVMAAAALLQKTGVDFNVLTVVNRQNAHHAKEIYRFFMERGFVYQQYIPCLDRLGHERGRDPWSLTPEDYGIFLSDLFDVWYEDRKKGTFVYIRDFENLAGMLMGYPPERCGMTGSCMNQCVLESDGTVYPCDFYMLDDYRLGDLRTENWQQIGQRFLQSDFLRESRMGLEECGDCRWYRLCRGGCRRDRQLIALHETGKNHYCDTMQTFYDTAVPRLKKLCGM